MVVNLTVKICILMCWFLIDNMSCNYNLFPNNWAFAWCSYCTKELTYKCWNMLELLRVLPLPAAVLIPVKPCFVIGLSATLICAFRAKKEHKNSKLETNVLCRWIHWMFFLFAFHKVSTSISSYFEKLKVVFSFLE